MAIIDCAGSGTPVSLHREKGNANIIIADKKACEKFQREMIFEIVDHIIFVLTDLNWISQEHLQVLRRVKSESIKRNKSKDRGNSHNSLYVVHNWRDAETESE